MNARNRKTLKESASLSPELAERLRHLVKRDGEAAVLALLGISGPTLGRASGGLAISPGTAAVIQLRLQDHDNERGGDR